MRAMLVCSMAMLVVTTLAGCDKARAPYERCLKLSASGDVMEAARACYEARRADPLSRAGKAADEKLSTELEPAMAKMKEEKRKADEAAAAKAADEMKARYKTMPTTLAKKIRDQAMWDLGRGTVTPAMDVITKELGQPVASYEGSYGAQLSFVWGARPKSTSLDDIEAAPFTVRMIRGLTCGDYGDGEIEWYSEGKRLHP